MPNNQNPFLTSNKQGHHISSIQPQGQQSIFGNQGANQTPLNIGNQSPLEFDYKTSQTNQLGESLPEGSKGWTPQGQVDWGGGLNGWAKKVYYNITGGDNRDDVWKPATDAGKAFLAGDFSRGGTLLKKASDQLWSDLSVIEDAEGGRIKESFLNTAEILHELRPSNLDEAKDISRYGDTAMAGIQGLGELYTAMRDSFGGDSPLTPVLRGTESLIGGVFEGMQAVAQVPKYGFGALQGIDSAGNGSWLPDFTNEEVIGETMASILNVSLVGYNIIRAITAPGTWKNKQEIIVSDTQAGRVFYSSLVEPLIRENYKRRLAEGEDPRLLAMELQNPIAEMVGEVLFDPMNLIGFSGKAARVAGMIDDAHDGYTASRTFANPAVANLFEDALRVGSDEAVAAALPKIVEVHQATVAARLGDTKSVFNQSYSFGSLTSTSRRATVSRNLGDFFNEAAQAMKHAGYGVEDVAEMWGQMARAASSNPDEAAAGLNYIMNNKYARMLLSENGIDAQIFLNKMLTDSTGKLTPDRILNMVSEADGDYVKLSQSISKMMDNATTTMFPTVDNMKTASETAKRALAEGKTPTARVRQLANTYDQLPQRVKFWSNIDAKVKAPKNGVNNVLGFGYFTANPGFTIRNFTANQTTMIADNGIGVYKKTAAGWREDLQGWLGFQSAAQEGFSEASSGAAIIGSGKFDTLRQSFREKGFAGLSALVEESDATKIVGFRLRDSMEKMLPAAVGDMADLKSLGLTDEAAEYFKKALVDNRGDVYTTVEDVRKLFGDTGVETWRISNYVTNKEQKFLQNINVYDEWIKLQKSGAGPDEIQAFFKKVVDEYEAEAAKVINDPWGVSASNPAAEMVQGIGAAADAGFVHSDDYVQMQAYLEEAYQARDLFITTLNKAGKEATQAAQSMGHDASAIFDSYTQMNEAVVRLGKKVRDEASALVDGTWKISDEIKNFSGDFTYDDAVSYFHRAGVSGMPEVAGSAEELKRHVLDKVWTHFRESQSNRWELYYDMAASESDAVLKTITPYIKGSEGLAAELDRTRKLMMRAQDARTAVFQGGRLKNTSLFSILDKFGVATQAESGAKLDERILRTINKYIDEPANLANVTKRHIPLDEAATVKLSELPEFSRNKIKEHAQQMLTDLNAGEAGARATGPGQLDAFGTSAYGSSNIQWYRDLNAEYGMGKKQAEAALNRIIDGKDTGVQAQRLKEAIVANLTHGDDVIGIPPDPAFLKSLNAPQNLIDDAAERYAQMSGKQMDVDAVLRESGYFGEAERILKGPADGVITGKGGKNVYDIIPEGTSLTDMTTQQLTDAGFPYSKLELRTIVNQNRNTQGLKQVAYKDILWNEETIDMINQSIPGLFSKSGSMAVGDDALAVSRKLGSLQEAEQNIDAVVEALNKRRVAMGLTPLDNAIVPPYLPGTQPSQARSLVENRRGFLELISNMEKRVINDQGKVSKIFASSELEAQLGKFADDLLPKISEARATSLDVARQWRDFGLHFYEGDKTYGDLMAAYYSPFQFWHTQTYKKMGERLVTDPRIFAAFGKYRAAMEKVNAEAPEWWRYNIKVDNVLGHDLDNPLYFNLEASLWPLNGLTGVDFNDPYKRTDWLTSTIDDLGKFGPSQHYLVNIAVASSLYLKGEQDAASRWGGRMFQQTALLKNTMAWAGFSPVELDPAVQFFSGGMDPYERNKVYRALAAMVQKGEVTEEQAMDAAYYQDNDIWNEAIRSSSAAQAGKSWMSLVGGVGFKPRTDEDMMVDNMYTEMNRMYSMAKFMSPDEYKDAWTNLRTKYPFMDSVLLSKKAGDERDTSYAYNILGRIPPGQADDLLNLVGVNNDDIQNFYDTKGDLSLMTRGDRDRFTGAMADLGAMLLMPDDITKSKWTAAKNAYADIFDEGAMLFGEDIWDKVDMYYSQDERADKNKFLAAHPEVEAALDWKTSVVATDPILYEMYGSIKTLESYYVGNMYAALESKYGNNIMDIYSEYQRLKAEEPDLVKSYKNSHPEIEAFLDARADMYDNLNRSIVNMANRLPDRPMVPVRPDFIPEGDSQKDLYNQVQPEQRASWQDFQQILSPQMQSMVVEYWQYGENLTSAAESRLNYLAGQYGFADGDAMMQEIGLALSQ
jgi:hypothetical protein